MEGACEGVWRRVCEQYAPRAGLVLRHRRLASVLTWRIRWNQVTLQRKAVT